MPAIITNKFRVNAAKQFLEDFSDNTTNDSYYLFYAKSTPWAEVKISMRDSTSGRGYDFKNDEVVWMDGTSAVGSRTYANAVATNGGGIGKVRYWDNINKLLYLTDVAGSFNIDGSNGVIFNNSNGLFKSQSSGKVNSNWGINDQSKNLLLESRNDTFSDNVKLILSIV